ncbi:uncharacterized protein LOC109719397 [Ananas comosus]|uniref:Uncharacterized protein LOC109719397 n=1 Tax=Ananas comosus TaxID=4615 RepID=A0A6P5G789_ANACO|nr:uncharacterized protein LOC109719397 [Ananas comosus]
MDEGDDDHHQTLENGGGGGTSIHITALDGVVNVNSLFTLAAFVGLAWNPSAGATPGAAPCDVDFGKLESDLVSFHVLAFACFLFSSLVALCLKQAIRAHHPRRRSRHAGAARVDRAALRGGIIACAAGSVFGCGFLMLALVNLVQIKLGRIGAAVAPLVTLVPAAMLVYTAIVLYAFTR